MTKLLDKAIAKIRELPAEDQDTVAVMVLSLAEEMPAVALEEDARAASVKDSSRPDAANSYRSKKSKPSGSITAYEGPLHAACVE